MNDQHEVISAFIDDEPFDASELAHALADPGGRALLIDLLSLRQVVQPPVDANPVRRVSPVRPWLAAAAILVAMAGGYVAGQFTSKPSDTVAPPATRVVEASGEWQTLP